MTQTAGGAVVAMAKHAERRVIDALRRQGATSADRAVPLAIARPGGKAALRRLIRGGSVVEDGERYWLDESRYEAVREQRRVSAVVALVVVALILAGIVLFGAARARAQLVPDDWRWRSHDGQTPVLRLQAFPDDPYPDYTVTFYAAPGQAPLDLDFLETRAMTAVRLSTDAPRQIARSVDCPAIGQAMKGLFLIDPMRIAPQHLTPTPPGPLMVPPTMKDGTRVRLALTPQTPNGAANDIVIDARQGDYAQWGNATLNALAPCWQSMT